VAAQLCSDEFNNGVEVWWEGIFGIWRVRC
jgi:hypothetical protein